jgi:hypothetical protein
VIAVCCCRLQTEAERIQADAQEIEAWKDEALKSLQKLKEDIQADEQQQEAQLQKDQ